MNKRRAFVFVSEKPSLEEILLKLIYFYCLDGFCAALNCCCDNPSPALAPSPYAVPSEASWKAANLGSSALDLSLVIFSAFFASAALTEGISLNFSIAFIFSSAILAFPPF